MKCFGLVNAYLMNYHYIYSQTCEQMPPKLDTDYGLYRQVVAIWRFLYFILSVYCLYLQDGLYWEVVFNTGLNVLNILKHALTNYKKNIYQHLTMDCLSRKYITELLSKFSD